MNSRAQIEQLRAEVEEAEKKIALLSEEVREESLYTDIGLYDKIKDLSAKYGAKDFKGIANLASSIANIIGDGAGHQIDREPSEYISEYAKTPPGYRLPKTWGLDEIELQRGVPVVIGAKSGVGKTTTACNIAIDNALKKVTTVIFSLEMTVPQIWITLFRIQAMIRAEKSWSFEVVSAWLKHPDHFKDEVKAFNLFVEDFKKYILVVEAENFTASRIATVLDRSVNYFGDMPKYAIVDYIQICSPEPSMMSRPKREQIIEQSKIFKNKSKSEQIILILLSQLNDQNEFRESKEIRDNTGVSIKLSRKTNEATGKMGAMMTISVDKNRFGPLAMNNVHFDGPSGAIIKPRF